MFVPEIKRLKQASRPVHLAFAILRVYVKVPMSPSSAKAIPIDDITCISNISFAYASEPEKLKTNDEQYLFQSPLTFQLHVGIF